jgi:hypothetical protein
MDTIEDLAQITRRRPLANSISGFPRTPEEPQITVAPGAALFAREPAANTSGK